MRGDSDVRRILDELNLNRVSIENDRKTYDRVRVQVLEVEQSLQKAVEQRSVYTKRLADLLEIIACRSSDVNMLNVKIDVLNEICEKLETEIENCRSQLKLGRKELVGISSAILQHSIAFSREWNCAAPGQKFRREQQKVRISELSTCKKNLEYELDNFLLMQRSVEYAEAEKLEFKQKFEEHKVQADSREAAIIEQLDNADKNLLDLNKKREELTNKEEWTLEFNRISGLLESTRKSITFLEGRVSETQRLLESQRKEPNFSEPIPRPIKVPRMFQFKKKPTQRTNESQFNH